MAENNGQDVQVPWFSGLCLEGEVAGQYEMDLSGSQQDGEDATKAGLFQSAAAWHFMTICACVC